MKHSSKRFRTHLIPLIVGLSAASAFAAVLTFLALIGIAVKHGNEVPGYEFAGIFASIAFLTAALCVHFIGGVFRWWKSYLY